jgi:hypothetical protein
MHFDNYQGFGTQGSYIGHWIEDVTDTAIRLLSNFRGKKVSLEYDESVLVKLSGFKYNSRLICVPVKRILDVPKNGNLDSLLFDVLTDNILIRVPIDRGQYVINDSVEIPQNQVYEIQRIVIGQNSISELSIW